MPLSKSLKNHGSREKPRVRRSRGSDPFFRCLLRSRGSDPFFRCLLGSRRSRSVSGEAGVWLSFKLLIAVLTLEKPIARDVKTDTNHNRFR